MKELALGESREVRGANGHVLTITRTEKKMYEAICDCSTMRAHAKTFDKVVLNLAHHLAGRDRGEPDV